MRKRYIVLIVLAFIPPFTIFSLGLLFFLWLNEMIHEHEKREKAQAQSTEHENRKDAEHGDPQAAGYDNRHGDDYKIKPDIVEELNNSDYQRNSQRWT